jgi:hypothetical protein
MASIRRGNTGERFMFDPYHKWLGICPGRRPPTYYQLLAISPNERDAEVIEEAAIRQTTHVRSYQLGPHAADCTRILNEIAEARQTLLNPAKREEYDAKLAGKTAVTRAPPAPLAPKPVQVLKPSVAVTRQQLPAIPPPPRTEPPPRARRTSRRANSRRPRLPWLAGGLVGLLGLIVLLSLTVFRVKTKLATVLVEIDQAGAEVSVDGKSLTINRPGDREPVRIDLNEGSHHLRVTKGGFETFTTQFSLKAGATETIRVRLEPVQLARSVRPAVPQENRPEQTTSKPPPEKPAPPGTERPDLTPSAGRVSPSPQKPSPDQAAESEDKDRTVAQNVLAIGGSVTVLLRDALEPVQIRRDADLPKAPFWLDGVYFSSNENLYDGTLVQLAGLRHIRHVVLLTWFDKGEVTDKGISFLAGLTSLQDLKLGGTRCRVTDAGLAHVAKLVNLEVLHFGGAHITDEGLRQLRDLTKLRDLGMAHIDIGDKGLEYLRQFPHLQVLRVGGGRITDNGLANLAYLTGLETLYVNGPRITNRGLVHLGKLTRLSSLDLSGTSISDRGLDHLRTLQNLTRLNVKGTKVSAQAISRFKKAVPKCATVER